jgi:hypothetical protein
MTDRFQDMIWHQSVKAMSFAWLDELARSTPRLERFARRLRGQPSRDGKVGWWLT